MTAPARLLAALLVLGLLGASAGCQSTSRKTLAASAGVDAASTLDAVPTSAQGREGGLLLRTGAIQLGPGAGRNAWRWMGDGQWGF